VREACAIGAFATDKFCSRGSHGRRKAYGAEFSIFIADRETRPDGSEAQISD
jgi:hypothetical protein